MKTLFFVFLIFVYCLEPQCQWATDPTVNNLICSAANYQDQSQIIEDGNGGAIIVWEDFRNGYNYDIYAQRISNNGVVQWTANGVVIASIINDQTTPRIIADGSGGAIITWNDFRGGNYSDIYAQKISANGIIQWTANGVPVCTANNSQNNPVIVSDGAGGAIISWQDKRNGALDIYAQRIDANGTAMWADNGISMCNEVGIQENPCIASDGTGGAIITWQDYRSSTNYDIYAQRINANGDVQWATNGLPICALTQNQVYPQITNNKTDEVIITWFDLRSGIDLDIYAQRLRNDGTVLWITNGVAICTAINLQQFPVLVDDASGGAIITWQDSRAGAYDVYAQRINVSGDVLWTIDGVPISTETNAQLGPDIVSDGQGGAIITWQDYRDNGNQDIYAQRINNNGTVQWTENGIAVSVATNDQYTPSITSDGNGGVIISWWDFRNGSNSDIYAQQVNHDGQLGVVTSVEEDITSLPESFSLEHNYPNPFNPSTIISWRSPVAGHQTLKVFDVLGNEVATLVDEYKPAGRYEVEFQSAVGNRQLASGVYLYKLLVSALQGKDGEAREYSETKKMILLR
ncbi:MAG: hypothetical protein ACK4R9_11680 [Ignavibacterium sp.]